MYLPPKALVFAIAGVAFPVGNSGQAFFLLLNAASPVAWSASAGGIMPQACLPSFRQQGGSFDSGRGADSNGEISGKLTTANSKTA